EIRPIGYGAMLIEGLVGVVALIAAASLDPRLYYDINVDLRQVPKWQKSLDTLYEGVDAVREARDPLHRAGVGQVHHLDLAQLEAQVGHDSLRRRTGGAVSLAVGMSLMFTKALHEVNLQFEGLIKYWYHFAIMFEALFILTTIDTGTRIARFLLQEVLG